ncbi:MAG TPA: hypothetical protein VGF50_11250, partial [Caulobacteraceae bacterium]
MRRRDLIGLIAASAAAPASALADDNHLALAKAFPMLEQYLSVPPAERSRFYLVYRATRDKRPVSDARGAIVGTGAPEPLSFDRAGFLTTRLPSLAQLKSAQQLVMSGAPYKLVAEARCAIAPSTRLEVAELAGALAQANAAVAKLAGPMAALFKLTAVYFPDAGGGHAVFADGRQTQ